MLNSCVICFAARAVEIFTKRVIDQAVEEASAKGARTLTSAHLKAAVHKDVLLDFLADTVAAAPDLAQEKEDVPKVKRQRSALQHTSVICL